MNHNSVVFDDLPPLSLYIHIPWCVRKCPYCDFNSHQQPDTLPVQKYINCLKKDLEEDLHLAQGRKLSSIFLGGGTPSLLPATAIGDILNDCQKKLNFDENIEITLETNPGTAEYSDFSALLDAGINRLSFGAQSFNNHQLQKLGRIHNADEIEKAVNSARQSGFVNYNIDLMHGLPGQSVDAALDDLNQAFSLEPTHISWYQLTIEPNTSFYSSPPLLPDEDTLSHINNAGLQLLGNLGFEQYEVSAYAKKERHSVHNLNYWEFGDYLAIGAGAHGKITRQENGEILRYQKTRTPDDYMDETKTFTSRTAKIDKTELAIEFMMNALRLTGGVAQNLFTRRTGLPYNHIQHQLDAMARKGLIDTSKDRIVTTPLGRNFLNSILAEFMHDT